ncbi:MAG: T9SS type A sorting domain-containing protein [candidate division Zixibacteria bacterium]|nr:T9SS type A sorting domain-containing protein [candidate division Zixibacteria bacterium]
MGKYNQLVSIGIILISMIFIPSQNGECSIIYVAGDVYGQWSADTVVVYNDIRVPQGETLIIDPGVEVIFAWAKQMIVDTSALLLAVGTETDTIEFCPQSVDSGWVGISFYSASSQTRLEYVKLETYGDVGIRCYDMDNIIIDRCEVSNCGHYDYEVGGGIHCQRSNIQITDCYIHECGWLYSGDSWGDPDGMGIIVIDAASAMVEGNVIENNYGGGMRSSASNISIIGNTFLENENRFEASYLYSDVYGFRDGGGLYINGCTAVVQNNTIFNNSVYVSASAGNASAMAGAAGGGIYIYGGSIILDGNFISGNEVFARSSSQYYSTHSTGEGGGILCAGTVNSEIRDNIVTYNFTRVLAGGMAPTRDSHGGGICSIGNINLHITDNTISDNEVFGNGIMYYDLLGAGMFVSASSDSIAHNIIKCNAYSAGITIRQSSCHLYRNLIVDNSDGGIQTIEGGSVVITNSTIANNSSFGLRGYAWLKNCIMWNNMQGGEPIVTYSDMLIPYPGMGNISADPQFVTPHTGDYHLSPYSPCIDAGDPDSPPDPDGSIVDMGAFHTPRPLSVDIEAEPDTIPILVPPGGEFGLTGSVRNECDSSVVVDLSSGVQWAGEYYELQHLNNLHLDPNECMSGHFIVHVPHYAPYGWYEYISKAGDFGNGLSFDMSRFPFAVNRFPQEEWHNKWGIVGSWESQEENRSTGKEAVSFSVYPNPFNSRLSINFRLQEKEKVKLTIHNLLGQRVGVLKDEVLNPGYHTIRWDADRFASGIYFIGIKCGDEFSIKRVNLIK